MTERVGTVAECWCYPVKSLQGVSADRLTIEPQGVAGDRSWGLVDARSGHLLAAKRYSRMLEAFVDGERIVLPDGTAVVLEEGSAGEVLSEWLGVPVKLVRPVPGESRSYEMTFDPPDDGAELFEIPSPEGSFVDLAAVHLLSTATLRAAAAARDDLDWDSRRFRPNLVLDSIGEGWEENGWIGAELRVGPEAVLRVTSATVRCAMPLRAQPARPGRPALPRAASLFAAMSELNTVIPNHLGAYAEVVRPGIVTAGDEVLIDPSR